MTYYFSGPTSFNIVAVPDGTGWKTTMTSAQSTALVTVVPPSISPNYYWQATATNGTETVTLGTGTLTVQKNLATAAPGFDGRTRAERDLLAVEEAISARISGGVIAEYTIGTRRLRNEPMVELLKLKSDLKLEVMKERRAQMIANGLGDPRNTYVRFTGSW